jgi:hypothetical protein
MHHQTEPQVPRLPEAPCDRMLTSVGGEKCRVPEMEKASMNLPKRIGSFAIVVAGVIAMIVAGCINSDARARKAAVAKVSAAPIQSQQSEKPIKLRYYGGPKSPMYPG